MAIFLLNKGIAEAVFKKMCASLYMNMRGIMNEKQKKVY